jgi:beta-lactamase regulating signal transducer with metallopeptidase domain
MSLLLSLPTGHAAQALAWALVNFVWQGAALAAAMFVLTHLLRPSASARYAIGVVTLMAMLAAPVATFVWMESSTVGVGVAELGSATLSPSDATAVDTLSSQAQSSSVIRPATFLPLLVVVWLIGVGCLSVRLVGGWMVTRRLVGRAVRPVGTDVQLLARGVASRLQLSRVVRIVESTAVSVPVMIGWLKPVVLLPGAALAGLSPTQLEALLAHELAHVRRHDYLVNLLQSVIETLLFYHPAVWWVSRQVRIEREHCCDDLAIGVCDRLVYASALTELATLTTPRLALAATDGSLLRRVRRILASGEADERPTSGWISITVLALVAVGLAPVGLVSSRSADRDGTLPASTASRESSATATPAGTAVRQDPVPIEPANARLHPADADVLTARLAAQGAAIRPATAVRNPGEAVGLMARLADARIRLDLLRKTETERHPEVVQLSRVIAELEQALQASLESPTQFPETELEATRKRLVDHEKELDQLRSDRAKLDMERAEKELKARREALAAQLEALNKRQAEARQMFEKGLAKPEVVEVLREQIAEVQRAIRQADADMEYKLAERVLEERQLEVARQFEQAQKEFARQKEQYERLLQEKAAADLLSNDEAAKAFANADREFARRMSASSWQLLGEDAIERSAVVDGSDARVKNHDVIVLSIDGEDALARVYAVDDNGAIRLPLIGAIRVQNLTPSQVEEAIAKQLTDRKIGASKNVHVELRRPR